MRRIASTSRCPTPTSLARGRATRLPQALAPDSSLIDTRLAGAGEPANSDTPIALFTGLFGRLACCAFGLAQACRSAVLVRVRSGLVGRLCLGDC